MRPAADTLSSLSTEPSRFGIRKPCISPDQEQQSKYWDALHLRSACLVELHPILSILRMEQNNDPEASMNKTSCLSLQYSRRELLLWWSGMQGLEH